MRKNMKNDHDVIIESIVEKELSEYKDNLKEKILKHFANPYCAKTDIGNVMYEKEIIELIDRI